MKCMCAQTRPRFILSSERVFGGMEFEPMLTPREKSPLPENFPRGGSNERRCGQRAQTLLTSYSGPRSVHIVWESLSVPCNPLTLFLLCAHRIHPKVRAFFRYFIFCRIPFPYLDISLWANWAFPKAHLTVKQMFYL